MEKVNKEKRKIKGNDIGIVGSIFGIIASIILIILNLIDNDYLIIAIVLLCSCSITLIANISQRNNREK